MTTASLQKAAPLSQKPGHQIKLSTAMLEPTRLPLALGTGKLELQVAGISSIWSATCPRHRNDANPPGVLPLYDQLFWECFLLSTLLPVWSALCPLLSRLREPQTKHHLEAVRVPIKSPSQAAWHFGNHLGLSGFLGNPFLVGLKGKPGGQRPF